MGAGVAIDAGDGVADEPLVGDGFVDPLVERDEAAQMRGDLAENLDARLGADFVAAQDSIEGERGLGRGHPLTQAGLEVGMVPEGVVFRFLNLPDVEEAGRGDGDDHGVGGEVAEALAALAPVKENSAEQISGGKKIDRAEEIADDDLTALQFQAGGVDDAQPEHALAQRLSPPAPFRENAVADRDDGEEDDEKGIGEILAEEGEEGGRDADEGSRRADDGAIDGPGEKTAEETGRGDAEDHALRRLDLQRFPMGKVEDHAASGFLPLKLR